MFGGFKMQACGEMSPPKEQTPAKPTRGILKCKFFAKLIECSLTNPKICEVVEGDDWGTWVTEWAGIYDNCFRVPNLWQDFHGLRYET